MRLLRIRDDQFNTEFTEGTEKTISNLKSEINPSLCPL